VIRALFLHKGGLYQERRTGRECVLVGKARHWDDNDEYALVRLLDDRRIIVMPLNRFCLHFNLISKIPGVTKPKEERFQG